MILNRKVTKLIFIALFTYVNVPFYFVGITSLHKAAYYALALIPIFLAVYRGGNNCKNLSTYSKLFLLYVISIFLVMIITGALSFDYLSYFVRLLVGCFASISIFCIWKYERNLAYITEDFSLLYLKSVAFYIFGTFVFICLPPLKEFWKSIIMDFGETDFSSFLEYITRFGFAGFSGFGCAFMVSSAAILMCFLFLNNRISSRQCKFYSVVSIIGSFFYGRIGFVVSIFACGMLALYLFVHGRRKILHFYVMILAVLIAFGFLLYFIFPNIQPFIDWLLEPVLNFIEKGKFESASTNGLGRMYENFHPSDKTLSIGDGYWLALNGKGYYGSTDVGFMRNIYYGGIFYCALLYSLIAVFLLYVYWAIKQQHLRGAFFIVFLMFVQFLLFELKGDVTFLYLKAYLPFYLYLVSEKKKEKFVV